MELYQTWRQMPTFTRHPKLVLTERADRPRLENSFEKDDVSWIRGRSSAMTQSVRTFDKLTPRVYRVDIDGPNSFVHRSITWYEQNVSRTAMRKSIGYRLATFSTQITYVRPMWWHNWLQTLVSAKIEPWMCFAKQGNFWRQCLQPAPQLILKSSAVIDINIIYNWR